jgi:hypothetical protein
MAVRLDGVEPRRLGGTPAVGGRAGKEHVVPGPVAEHAEDRLDGAAALLDVHALVADGVAVVRRHLVRDHVADPHVAVAEHQAPALHRVGPARLDGCRESVQPEMARLQRMVRRQSLVRHVPHLAVHDRGGDAGVVEQ